jgi:hypothetical protein
MRLKRGIAGVVFVLLALTVVMAADKANFSGTWAMDQSKSEGLPPDVEQVMKVSQTDDKMVVGKSDGTQ